MVREFFGEGRGLHLCWFHKQQFHPDIFCMTFASHDFCSYDDSSLGIGLAFPASQKMPALNAPGHHPMIHSKRTFTNSANSGDFATKGGMRFEKGLDFEMHAVLFCPVHKVDLLEHSLCCSYQKMISSLVTSRLVVTSRFSNQ